jgi:hemerythrin-like domain-containing protein
MIEGVAEYKAGNQKAPLKIAENARKYVELLFQHIDKEDNILYPMSEARLSEDKMRELEEEFEKVEKEKIGQGKHEEFHKLLHRLKELYL